MSTDPETTICFVSAQPTTERALRYAKDQYRRRVTQEGDEDVFSAIAVEFTTVDESYSGKSVVCCLWAARIPREREEA